MGLEGAIRALCFQLVTEPEIPYDVTDLIPRHRQAHLHSESVALPSLICL